MAGDGTSGGWGEVELSLREVGDGMLFVCFWFKVWSAKRPEKEAKFEKFKEKGKGSLTLIQQKMNVKMLIYTTSNYYNHVTTPINLLNANHGTHDPLSNQITIYLGLGGGRIRRHTLGGKLPPSAQKTTHAEQRPPSPEVPGSVGDAQEPAQYVNLPVVSPSALDVRVRAAVAPPALGDYVALEADGGVGKTHRRPVQRGEVEGRVVDVVVDGHDHGLGGGFYH